MNRRDFITYLATLAAGAAALPQQLDVFKHLYEVNAPKAASGLLAVNSFILGFEGAPHDGVALFKLMYGADDQHLPFALNTRGFLHYVTPPHLPLMSTVEHLRWSVEENGHGVSHAKGTVLVTDQEGVIRNFTFDGYHRTSGQWHCKEYL